MATLYAINDGNIDGVNVFGRTLSAFEITSNTTATWIGTTYTTSGNISAEGKYIYGFALHLSAIAPASTDVLTFQALSSGTIMSTEYIPISNFTGVDSSNNTLSNLSNNWQLIKLSTPFSASPIDTVTYRLSATTAGKISFFGSGGNLNQVIVTSQSAFPTYYTSMYETVSGSSTILSASGPMTLSATNGPFKIYDATKKYNITSSTAGPSTPILSAANPLGNMPNEYSINLDGSYELAIKENIGDLSDQDFTAECWINLANTTGSKAIFLNSNGTASNTNYNIRFAVEGSALYARVYQGSGTSYGTSAVGSFTAGVWYHIAVVVKAHTYIQTFINGSMVDNSVITGTLNNPSGAIMKLGGEGDGTIRFNGWIYGYKFSKEIIYKTNFIPSYNPLTYNSNTTFLLKPTYDHPNNLSYVFTGSNSLSTQYYDFSSASYTTDCWVYLNNVTGLKNLFTIRMAGSDVGTNFTIQHIFNANTLTVNMYSGGTGYSVSVGTFVANTWYHIAIVRNGTTLTPYINQVAQTGVTIPATCNTSAGGNLFLGVIGASNIQFMNGYMTNIRVLSGVALTYNRMDVSPASAVAGTVLLAKNSVSYDKINVSGDLIQDTYKDISTNNFSVSSVNMAVSAVNPFTVWDASDTNFSNISSDTGSLILTSANPFNSTNEWSLSCGYSGSKGIGYISKNTIFEPSATTPWTWDGWVFPTVAGIVQNIFLYSSMFTGGGANAGWYMQLASSGSFACGFYANDSGLDINAGVVSLNAWNHFAFTNDGTNVRAFLNGSVIGTVAAAGHTPRPLNASDSALMIGSGELNTSILSGALYDFRWINGRCLYDRNFIVPSKPSSIVNNTKLLLKQSPFGRPNYKSSLFLGSGYQLISKSTQFEPAANTAWTMECWVNTTTSGSYQRFMSYTAGTGGPDYAIYLQITNTNVFEGGFYYSGNNVVYITAGTTVPTNKWIHVAMCSDGTTMRLFVNGTSVGTPQTVTGLTPNYASGDLFQIGREYFGGTAPLYGTLFQPRFIKGTALYTSNFKVPISPLTNITNTSFLLSSNSSVQPRKVTVNTISGYDSFNVHNGGTLEFAQNSASTVTIYGSGGVNIGSGGTFSIGSSARPLVYNKQNTLILSGCPITVNNGASFNTYGGEKTIGAYLSVQSPVLTSNFITVSAVSAQWLSGDNLVFVPNLSTRDSFDTIMLNSFTQENRLNTFSSTLCVHNVLSALSTVPAFYNITRSVVINGLDSSNKGTINILSGSLANIQNTQFQYLGLSGTNRNGHININNNSTGLTLLSNCVFYGDGQVGILPINTLSGSSTVYNLTANNNICYGFNKDSIISSTLSTVNYNFTGNVMLSCRTHGTFIDVLSSSGIVNRNTTIIAPTGTNAYVTINTGSTTHVTNITKKRSRAL